LGITHSITPQASAPSKRGAVPIFTARISTAIPSSAAAEPLSPAASSSAARLRDRRPEPESRSRVSSRTLPVSGTSTTL